MNTLLKTAAGLLVGAGLGLGMYYFIGCRSGSCAITSNIWVSTIFGALLGLVAVTPSPCASRSCAIPAEKPTDKSTQPK